MSKSREQKLSYLLFSILIIASCITLFNSFKRKETKQNESLVSCDEVKFPYAARYSKRVENIDNVVLEVGSSTTNILPLLRKYILANKNFVTKVYGQERRGYILISITIDSFSKENNDSVYSFEHIVTSGKKLIEQISAQYPCREGKMSFVSNNSRIWDSIEWEFKEGKILSQQIEPNINIIREREMTCKSKQNKQTQKKFVCSLKDGKLGELQIGDIIKCEKLIAYIGENPDQNEKDFLHGNVLKYFDLGFEIYYKNIESSNQCQITQIVIFPEDYVEDYSGESFKAYQGEIIPDISKATNISTIFKYFDMPSKVASPLLVEVDEYYYSQSWGDLVFCFDKNEDLLYLAFQYK